MISISKVQQSTSTLDRGCSLHGVSRGHCQVLRLASTVGLNGASSASAAVPGSLTDPPGSRLPLEDTRSVSSSPPIGRVGWLVYCRGALQKGLKNMLYRHVNKPSIVKNINCAKHETHCLHHPQSSHDTPSLKSSSPFSSSLRYAARGVRVACCPQLTVADASMALNLDMALPLAALAHSGA